MKKIFWIAGEASGDLHASYVLKQINSIDGNIEHYGIGGPKMQKQGLKAFFDFKRFNVMGFVEVIKHIRFFINIEKKIEKMFLASKPDLVILVDYPGFNFRIATLAKRLGIKVLYYISPQFWAWKKKRVYKMKKLFDETACILPFEEKLLQDYGVNAEFVGHPICEELEFKYTKQQFAEKHGLDLNKKWVGFFPGSRENEITKLLPEFLKAIKHIDKDIEPVFSVSNSIDENRYKSYLKGLKHLVLVKNDNYDIMKHCDFIVAKSGTTSLETALCETPMLIAYKVNPLSYHIAKNIIKIKYIGLPNIIFDEAVVPELIQHDANGKNLAKTINMYLNDDEKYNQLKQKLAGLHSLLSKKSASKLTAQKAIKLLGAKK